MRLDESETDQIVCVIVGEFGPEWMMLGDTIPTVFSGAFLITSVLKAYQLDCVNLNEPELRVNLLSDPNRTEWF